jgi:3-deoxy-manno-octulosonate cytidylyltransferase (CMP-KDO synthetase)
MNTIGVIPARWGATRFEGKVLAEIAGKPMIQHVWERACQSKKLEQVMIACDDARVFKTVAKFGAKLTMTSPKHASGTDRVAEAVNCFEYVDVVVNIQADEPLINPRVIDDLVTVFENDEDCSMATVIKRIENNDELQNPNVVKVVVDESGNALYFSRSPIPYNRKQGDVAYYKHLGIYAYRKKFLMMLTKLPKSKLEEAEQLEQLRVLEAGYKIKTVETKYDTIAVDTREDLKKVEEYLRKS